MTQLRKGVRLEVFTVAWMVVEAGMAIGAGIVAGSFLLVAFGLDSVLELISGVVLLRRLSLEANGADPERAEAAEARANWFVAGSLTLLCLYVLAMAIFGLVTQTKPESSPLGIGVSLAAVLVMPYLGITKRRVAAEIDSEALRGDAAESITCAYMAATVLVGVSLNALFGWWWSEDVAALVFLFWLVSETREAFEPLFE